MRCGESGRHEDSAHDEDEGGLVHIAKAVKTPSVVLFGPTQEWFFSYQGNINLRNSDCWCHCQDPFWERGCMKEKFKTFWSPCMNAITVDEVKRAIMVDIDNVNKQEETKCDPLSEVPVENTK